MAEQSRNRNAGGKGSESDPFKHARLQMVHDQIRTRGITDPLVLEAMEEVPRHRFVVPLDEAAAYDDNPLPIGFGQTISQPYIVALMTAALQLKEGDRVLEIGTGSGYQTAILSRLAREVYSIEFVKSLAEDAERRLQEFGCDNVHIRVSDGYEGWPEEAPFDGIIVTAAPEEVPDTLIAQLSPKGRLVIPVGVHYQELFAIEKVGDALRREKLADVRFVPMVRRKAE
jgi:protein-L-isoaspartate(D-aspartate) O-methyltransferase